MLNAFSFYLNLVAPASDGFPFVGKLLFVEFFKTIFSVEPSIDFRIGEQAERIAAMVTDVGKNMILHDFRSEALSLISRIHRKQIQIPRVSREAAAGLIIKSP